MTAADDIHCPQKIKKIKVSSAAILFGALRIKKEKNAFCM